MHHPIVIPNLRDAIRHAVPNVVEGKLVPVVIFIALLELTGKTTTLLTRPRRFNCRVKCQ